MYRDHMCVYIKLTINENKHRYKYKYRNNSGNFTNLYSCPVCTSRTSVKVASIGSQTCRDFACVAISTEKEGMKNWQKYERKRNIGIKLEEKMKYIWNEFIGDGGVVNAAGGHGVPIRLKPISAIGFRAIALSNIRIVASEYLHVYVYKFSYLNPNGLPRN